MGSDETEYCEQFTGFEMMLVSACRQITNEDIVFNAFHWPFLAVHMAKQLHAPEVFFAIETGMFQDQLAQLALCYSPTELQLSHRQFLLIQKH